MTRPCKSNDWHAVVDREGVVIIQTLASTPLKSKRLAAAEVFGVPFPTLRSEDGMRVARVRLIALEPK